MATAHFLLKKILDSQTAPGGPPVAPALALTPIECEQLRLIFSGASDLCDRLGRSLKWEDREIAFDQYEALTNALDGKIKLPVPAPFMPRS